MANLLDADKKGKPAETKKQIYKQAFVIYGLTAYYKASRNNHGLNAAIELFNPIDKYAFDAGENG